MFIRLMGMEMALFVIASAGGGGMFALSAKTTGGERKRQQKDTGPGWGGCIHEGPNPSSMGTSW